MALKNLKAINRDIPSQVEEAMARDGATAHAFPAGASAVSICVPPLILKCNRLVSLCNRL